MRHAIVIALAVTLSVTLGWGLASTSACAQDTQNGRLGELVPLKTASGLEIAPPAKLTELDRTQLAPLRAHGAAVYARGGLPALRAATMRLTGAQPDHVTARRWATCFSAETDPVELWTLAQGIRFRDHTHWGTIWSHDAQAERIMAEQAQSTAHPFRRLLAIDVLGDHALALPLTLDGLNTRVTFLSRLLDTDEDVHVRALCAARIAAPRGASIIGATTITDVLFELLRHEEEYVRAQAATGIAAWCWTAEQQESVLEIGRTDESLAVRRAVFAAVRHFGTPTAHTYLRGIADDETHSDATRAAARTALTALPVAIGS